MKRPDLDVLALNLDDFGRNTSEVAELFAYIRYLEQKVIAHHEIGVLEDIFGEVALKFWGDTCPICKQFKEEQ